MVGRPKRLRRMALPPVLSGFRPCGLAKGWRRMEPVVLHFDEYEALRLCDFEGRTQEEAADSMQVSRPTLTRICMSARRKMAQALVEGRHLHIEGGEFYLESERCHCGECGAYFDAKTAEGEQRCCPLCGHGFPAEDVSEDGEALSEDDSFDELREAVGVSASWAGRPGQGLGVCDGSGRRDGRGMARGMGSGSGTGTGSGQRGSGAGGGGRAGAGAGAGKGSRRGVGAVEGSGAGLGRGAGGGRQRGEASSDGSRKGGGSGRGAFGGSGMGRGKGR